MKRLHVHLAVSDLERSIAFYSSLFGSAPTVLKPDYARWMVDDPAVNFAISDRAGEAPGVSHLGVQAADDADLAQIEERIGETTCCYSRSRKSWTADPDGIAWEAFLTHGESEDFGADPDLGELSLIAKQPDEKSCCGEAA